jgi:hypothetical protein
VILEARTRVALDAAEAGGRSSSFILAPSKLVTTSPVRRPKRTWGRVSPAARPADRNPQSLGWVVSSCANRSAQRRFLVPYRRCLLTASGRFSWTTKITDHQPAIGVPVPRSTRRDSGTRLRGYSGAARSKRWASPSAL